MSSINPEWNEFRKNPDLRHDDDQRNDLFYASPAGQDLATQVSVTNATIPARDEFHVPIRIYTSKESKVRRGIVVFFHSGGFTGGSLETEDVSCRYIALNAPVTVISVEYRLSPENQYPIPMNDGVDAFQYIASNVQQFVAQTTEPVKLVLSGTSSGGHLAAIVSQNARNWFQVPQNAKLASQVQLSGVLLRAPVTVNAMYGGALVPPVYKSLHQSWMMQYEGADLDRLSMTYNHGRSTELAYTTPNILYFQIHSVSLPTRRQAPRHTRFGAILRACQKPTSRFASWIFSGMMQFATREDFKGLVLKSGRTFTRGSIISSGCTARIWVFQNGRKTIACEGWNGYLITKKVVRIK